MNRNFPWYDDTRPFEERIELLIQAMTPEEKVSQMLHEAPAIERLGIPAYNWWNEALHGVARAGRATIFPQSIGSAATFNPPLLRRIGDAIALEGRAKHHQGIRNGNRGQYFGLTYWTPNINIFRDPRWGRGQETYGECPYLTSRMGVELIRGLQGDDPKYLKSAACAKHFIVHSGPENLRHTFNARVSGRDFFQTYARAFKAAVQEANVESVMGAYNRTNGDLCCGSKKYITRLLRGAWGFAGHFLSDCWAIRDFHTTHKVTGDAAQSSALAVRNGCDLNCGCSYHKLTEALERGLITEAELDTALRRLFRTRMKLGMFDADDKVPLADTPVSVVNCAAHRALALEAARQSMVLLKNDGILPLKKDPATIAVTGPNAMSITPLLGNYNGFSGRMTTVLEGIMAKVSPGTQIDYHAGCDLAGNRPIAECELGWVHEHHPEYVIAVMGLTAQLEGEEAGVAASDGGGDRTSLGLPAVQRKLLEFFIEKKIPVVLVVLGGSALDLSWEQEHCAAVLYGWYPGEAGGEAVADVLFGDCNPAGRLPVTFPKSLADVPEFTDYNMAGRTYRYSDKEPLYPFGYGLSYTTFAYSGLKLSRSVVDDDCGVVATVEVTNTGNRAGDEVVQLYLSCRRAPEPMPLCELAAVQRISLQPGETRKVELPVAGESLLLYRENGDSYRGDAEFELSVGGGQPRYTTGCVTATLQTKAEGSELK